MRVLVTGGAGFIGSAIVDQLVDHGHEVTVIDDLLPAAHHDKPDYLNDHVDYQWIDIRDSDAMRDAVRGHDVICHQASMVGLGVDYSDAAAYVSHNDLGTAVLLAALHETSFAGRIVLASSMVVYGEGGFRCEAHGEVRPSPRAVEDLRAGRFEPRCPMCGRAVLSVELTEDAPVDPRNVYAATKLHQEHLCRAYAIEHGSSVVALRYHNVYGPRMPRDTPYAGVASIFRSAAERGEPPQVFEDGCQRRDFVHVRDVARANLFAIEAPPGTAGAFNIASGEPKTVLDMATALAEEIGHDDHGPRPEVTGSYRLGDVRHIVASPERAERVLGFRPTTSFDQGMREFATASLRT